MADPAVAAMAAAGDSSDASASLSLDPDMDGEWPVKEEIISERLGEQAFASGLNPAKGEGSSGSATGSSSGSLDQGTDAEAAARAAANKAEASAKGYGKLYAAFGGAREGLEACAAGEPWLVGMVCASTMSM